MVCNIPCYHPVSWPEESHPYYRAPDGIHQPSPYELYQQALTASGDCLVQPFDIHSTTANDVSFHPPYESRCEVAELFSCPLWFLLHLASIKNDLEAIMNIHPWYIYVNNLDISLVGSDVIFSWYGPSGAVAPGNMEIAPKSNSHGRLLEDFRSVGQMYQVKTVCVGNWNTWQDNTLW